MKKLFFIMLIIACLFIPLTTQAMELETTEAQYGLAYDEALAELHTGYYITGITYGEIVDGCFVRTYEEEVAIINRMSLQNSGKVDVGYETMLAQEKRLTENTEFTSEMEAAGYHLSEDGTQILDPNTGEGYSSGGFYDSVTVGPMGSDVTGPSGTLTIIAQVSSEIREKEYPINVTLGNEANQAFVITLQPYNNYVYMDVFPAGTYTVMEAGVPGDITSQYPLTYVDEEMAVVSNGGAGMIEMGIAYFNADMTQALVESLENSEYTFQDYKQEATLREAEEAQAQAEEEARAERASFIKTFLPLIVGLGVLVMAVIIAILVFVNWIKKNNRLS